MSKIPATSGTPFRNKEEEIKNKVSQKVFQKPKIDNTPKVMHSDGTLEPLSDWAKKLPKPTPFKNPSQELTQPYGIGQKIAADLEKKSQEAREKADLIAQKYDQYTGTPEYKAGRQQYLKDLQDNISPSAAAAKQALPYIPNAANDAAEALKKEKERAEAEADRANDYAVHAKNLAEINAMPADVRKALDAVVEDLSTRGNGGLNLILEFKNKGSDKILAENGYDKKRAKELAESLIWQENAEFAEEAKKYAEKVGEEHPVLGSAASVPVKLAGAVTAPYAYLTEMISRTGQYSTLDPNNAGNVPNFYVGSLRNKVTEKIIGEDPSAIRRAAAYLYQGGMETIDNLTRVAAFGSGSLALMGLDSFGQKVQEASENGASPSEAIAQGIVSAGIEVVTEKIPLDNLLDTAKTTGKPLADVIIKAVGQAGIEAGTEELSLILDLASEAMILREHSGYNTMVSDFMAQGLSEADAKKAADKALLSEAIDTAIISGMSGTMSSLGSSAYANISNRVRGNAQAQETVAAEAQAQPGQGQITQEAVAAQAAQETAQVAQPQATQQAEAQAQTAEAQRPEVAQETAAQLAQNAPQVQKPEKTQEQIALNDAIAKTLADNGFPDRTQQTQSPDQTVQAQTEQAAQPQAEQQTDQTAQPQQPAAETQQSAAYETPAQDQISNPMETPGRGTSTDFAPSKTFTNTGLNNASAEVRQGYRDIIQQNPEAPLYEVKHRADTLRTAQERVATPDSVNAEYNNLMAKEHWDADDVATANLLQDRLMKSGDPDATEKFMAFSEKKKEVASAYGQAIDAFRIQEGTMEAARNPVAACDSFYKAFDSMTQDETVFNPKKHGQDFENWKKGIKKNVTALAMQIDMVPEGNAEDMRAIIREIARKRKTTAWLGYSNNLSKAAESALDLLGYDDLKIVANTQIASMADDFRKRGKFEVVESIRKSAMLSSIKTMLRNLTGNASVQILDSSSESTAGRFADFIMSKFTGKKTIGNEFSQNKTYLKAASKALKCASLCIELNIPIESSFEASYQTATGGEHHNKYVGKTFRSNGKFATRFLYAYQQGLSYALEASDQFFKGGTNAQVKATLQNLKNSGLTDDDIDSLSEYVALRRTFKNATWTDENGKEHGSNLSRAASGIKEGFTKTKVLAPVAEHVMPFVSTGANVAQTGIDYMVGTVKGAYEVATIIRDAKAGKKIDVRRQRQAASDFARGVRGIELLALFTAASAKDLLKVNGKEDPDEKALLQSQGVDGAVFNLSGFLRMLTGEDTKWEDEDILQSWDYLEPFNTLMYLGYELAQEQGLASLVKAPFDAILGSVMDSPVFSGLQNTADMIQELFGEEKSWEDQAQDLAKYGGEYVSSFIPQFVRQAAQVNDFYRDTRGDTPAETAWNSLKAALPWAAPTLPKKVNGLGEAQKRDGIWNTFIDPSKPHRYNQDDVADYLEALREQLPDDVSFIPDRQAPISLSVNGIERPLDGAAREKYQTVYGEHIQKYYSGLMNNPEFRKLTPELQSVALQKAEKYATDYAKNAVSEYRELPKESGSALINGIVQETVLGAISNIFGDYDIAQEYGYDDKEHKKALDAAYDQYKALSPDVQSEILDAAISDTARYLEVRDNGVSQGDFLEVKGNVDTVRGTGKVNEKTGIAGVRDIDKREAIAGTGDIDPEVLDIIMHAYMPDYDPEAESKETTEFKYDYIRQELGLSPEEYVSTYRAYLDTKGSRNQINAIKDLGYDQQTARILKDIFAGKYKEKLIGMYGQN